MLQTWVAASRQLEWIAAELHGKLYTIAPKLRPCKLSSTATELRRLFSAQMAPLITRGFSQRDGFKRRLSSIAREQRKMSSSAEESKAMEL